MEERRRLFDEYNPRTNQKKKKEKWGYVEGRLECIQCFVKVHRSVYLPGFVRLVVDGSWNRIDCQSNDRRRLMDRLLTIH